MDTFAREFGFTREQQQAIAAKGFDLVESGDFDGAAIVFTGLLAIDPFDAPIHAALGAVLHEQGKLTEAEAAYDTALGIEKTTVLALVNRGDIRCQRGDPGGLEDLLAAARRPSSVQARAAALMRRYSQ